MDGDPRFPDHFHVNGKTPANGSRKRAPKSASPPDDCYPLVADDGLFVRIFPGGSSSPQAKARTAGVEHALRSGFVPVWHSLSGQERQRILTYVHEPKDLSRNWQPSRFTPVIEVRDLDFSSPTVRHCGMEIIFPAALIEKAPQRLPFEIALVLARLLMYGNRRHWRLVMEMIEEPLEQWERSLGKKVTAKARNDKLDALEVEFLRVHTAEMAALVRSWGIEEPSPHDERGTREE